MSFQSILSLIHMFLINYNAHETKSCSYGDHKVFTVCHLGRHSTLRETTDAFLTNSHVFKLLFSDETAQCIANKALKKSTDQSEGQTE